MQSERDDFEESKEMKSLLEEKFSQFLTEDEPPQELKKEVFNSLNSLIMLGDLADLFTVKFAQTNIGFISPFEGHSEEKKDEKKEK